MSARITVVGIGWFLASGLAITLSGCGTSDYNAQLNLRLDQLRAGAPFRILWAPTSIPDTPVKIRVPQVFNKSYVENSAHPEDGPKVRPDRIQPPFLQLPGFRICYEGRGVDPNRGKMPYYCYLAVVPAKPGDADKLAADLQAKLKQTFKEVPDWEQIDAATPEGRSMQWKKIRVTGDQPFPINQGRKDEKGVPIVTETLPGIFELWIRDAQQYVVLVGWRAPVGAEGPTTIPTIKTAADLFRRPTADKIDLKTLPVLTAGSLVIESAVDATATAQLR